MTNKVKLRTKDWDTTCADGCCYEYGTELYINDELFTTYFDGNVEQLVEILTLLEHECAVEYD